MLRPMPIAPRTLAPLAALLCGLIAVGAAHAAPPRITGAVPPPATGTITASYSGLRAGIKVIEMTASFTIRPDAYHAHVQFNTAGVFRMFVRADSETLVDGVYTAAAVQPQRLQSHGELRGTPRQTEISFTNGTPKVESISPPPAEERSAVPDTMLPGAIDNISAMALLMRAAAGGRCDGSATVFDGRRMADVTAATIGTVTLESSRRSLYAGPALLCHFTSRQTAGFIKGQDEASLRAPKEGAVWVARVAPNAPPIPVRFDFDSGAAGTISLYLTEVHGGALETVGPAPKP